MRHYVRGILLALLSAASAPAQDAHAVDPVDVALFNGANMCKRCHSQPVPSDLGNALDFVLLTEYPTWRSLDKHSLAYTVLEGPRGQAIAERMKLEKPAHETKACLSCHAVSYEESRLIKDEKDPFSPKDGVNCEVCHGPSGGIRSADGNITNAWYGEHSKPAWRRNDPDAKRSFGMVDLRNPVIKAELCYSCHIGNAKEGRIVSHAMYAAGHPPLPSVNIADYARNEPMHWRTMDNVPFWKSEEAAPVRDAYGYRDDRLFETRDAVIGNLVAIRTSARLIADRASIDDSPSARLASGVWPEVLLNADAHKAASEGPGPEQALRSYWPEMAMTHTECYACHHDLQRPSWRQLRGYVGTPGRPLPQAWPTALVEVALAEYGQPDAASDFHAALDAFLASYDSRPFGDPEQIQGKARELADWTDTFIRDRILPQAFDPAQSLSLAKALTDHLLKPGPDGKLVSPDYETARQIASTIEVITRELLRRQMLQSPDSDDLVARLDQWDKTLNLGRYPGSEDRDKLSLREIQRLAEEKIRNFQGTLGKFGDWTPGAVGYNASPEEFFDASTEEAQTSLAAISGIQGSDFREAYVAKKFREDLQEINNLGIADGLRRVACYDPETFRRSIQEFREVLDRAALAEH